MSVTYSCTNCGADATVVRGDYDFRESGLDYVVLNNIALITCSTCGNQDPIIRNPKKLMGKLVIAVASKPERLEGQDVRFIRKQLVMTQEAFAKLIHVDKTTVSKWENNADQVGLPNDLLIRSFAITLSSAPDTLKRELMEGFSEIATSHAVSRLAVDAEHGYTVTAKA